MTDEHGDVEKLIGEAEDVVDPLAGLVEKSAADPGAPFAPEVLIRSPT